MKKLLYALIFSVTTGASLQAPAGIPQGVLNKIGAGVLIATKSGASVGVVAGALHVDSVIHPISSWGDRIKALPTRILGIAGALATLGLIWHDGALATLGTL